MSTTEEKQSPAVRSLLSGPVKDHPPGPGSDVFLTLRPECKQRRDVGWTFAFFFLIAFVGMHVVIDIVWMNSGWWQRHPKLGAAIEATTMTAATMALLCIIQWLRFTYIRWHCPGCGKTLHDHACWYCSYCDKHNRRRSFLNRCGNPACGATPLAYECEHNDCRALSYFTTERNGRHPARFEQRQAPAGKTREEIRTERDRLLEDHEHEIKALTLQMKIQELRLRMSSATPKDDKQARVEAALREIDQIIEECQTIADSAVVQEKFNARIDRDERLDDEKRTDVKHLASMKFAQFRLQRGGEISMDKEKRPSY